MKASALHCRLSFAAAVLICCACNSTQQVGSKYVKTEKISASQGGSLTVAASDSPELAGAKLVIPPGALAADQEITLELGSAPITQGGDKAAGQVALWGPSGTRFAMPVEMTLPYTLSEGETADRLFVQGVEDDGTRFVVDRALVTVDTESRLLRFQVVGFTGFQPGTNTACMSNNDCGMGQTCVNGVCKTPGCSAPNGGACQCTSNSECAMGQVCTNGLCQSCTSTTCAGQCSSINQCPMGQACLNGLCAICFPNACASSCGPNAPCPMGKSCLNGVCQSPACGPNAPCPMGQTCNANGACQPTQSGCGPNAPCAMGQVCLNGQCTTQMNHCGPNALCAQGQYCNANGSCVTCNPMTGCPQCDASHVCSTGKVCVNGTCQTCSNGACAQCQVNADCPNGQACVQGRCQATMTQCGPNAPCPMGQVCTSAGSCVSNNACGANNLCPMGQQCINGVCGTPGPNDAGVQQCNAQLPCPMGQSCLNGICRAQSIPDGGNTVQCMTTGDCAMGQSCVQGICRTTTVPDSGTPSVCGPNSPCAMGQSCVMGQCVTSTPPDAGSPQCGGVVCSGMNQVCYQQQCQTLACSAQQLCPGNLVCQAGFCH